MLILIIGISFLLFTSIIIIWDYCENSIIERWTPEPPPVPPYTYHLSFLKLYGKFLSDEHALEFRNNYLLPAISNDKVSYIVIDLDGCFCYSPSFLKTVFKGINSNKIHIICKDEPTLIEEIKKYMRN